MVTRQSCSLLLCSDATEPVIALHQLQLRCSNLRVELSLLQAECVASGEVQAAIQRVARSRRCRS